jgi:signal peptidase I
MDKTDQSTTLWYNLKQIIFFLAVFIILKTSIVAAYKIPSPSMEGTLLVGDFLVANQFVYGARLPLIDWRFPAISRPEPGDIVIFIYPGDSVTKYIKRCVAGPGDTVEVKNKQLFVNGSPSEMPEHAKFTDAGGIANTRPRSVGVKGSRDNFGPYVVPEDSYFMMGDNRDNSYDSRFWGAVPYDMILGEAIFIHWSWDDSIHKSSRVSITDPLSVPRAYINDAVYFLQKVRWDRLFNLIS